MTKPNRVSSGKGKTYGEIKARASEGNAMVMTAMEFKKFVKANGVKKAAKEVDIVTTGTFGAMCSSGAYFNLGHSDPPIKIQRAWMDGVPAYAGIAAVDLYLGATELDESNNMMHGGAHVIEDLVRGRAVRLKATARSTDCYPLKEIDTYVSLKTMNQAVMMNVRNCYQNYGAASNSSGKTLYTYMGKLLPELGNATYSSAGELSPLLNDPYYRTIGIGTRIFLGGGEGFVAWEGTQFNPGVARTPRGVPKRPAGSLAVIGDLNQMSSDFVKGLTFTRYGTSLGVGMGVPIPILDEDMASACAVTDDKIFTAIFDYSQQRRSRPVLKEVSYAELNSGEVSIKGKRVPTSPLSSQYKAMEITKILKKRILDGSFAVTEPVQRLPLDKSLKTLDVRSEKEAMK
ncbi:MAG: homocysteine biosynthesis protein [Thermoplasmata archaeon]|nr:homocysteine biosynthesis protein [Thermoplasmata archaeon]